MTGDAALRQAYDALLDAAETVAAGETDAPPPGEWDADRVLAHVALVTSTTLEAVAAVAAGTHTTYDNRIALDTWTIDRVVHLAGGGAGLRERLRRQGEALDLATRALSSDELATPVPTRLLSHGQLLVDQALPLSDLVTGLTDVELPGHRQQLLALRAT
jgi:hypothetical protein